MNRYTKTIVLVVLGLVFTSFLTAGWIALFTQMGSAYVLRTISNNLTGKKEIVWQSHSGTLMSEMVYENIEISDLELLPKPNVLKIQRITVESQSVSMAGLSLLIENARLILPNADPILLYGNLENGLMDFNISSKSLSTLAVENFIHMMKLKNIQGDFSDIDITISGPLQEPHFEGEFIVEKLTKDKLSLTNSSVKLNLTLKEDKASKGLFGTVTLQDGTLFGKQTAIVKLRTSSVIFSGDPQKPNFDILAKSSVGKLKMDITVKGSFEKPDLQLKSDPPMPKERLLLALATNKTWQNTEDVLNNGVMTTGIAKDFIDYFIFGRLSNKFAERFGLNSLSIKYDKKEKGVAVSKDLSERMEGNYSIDALKTEKKKSSITQKIGGQYKVTDTISIEGQKEILNNNDDSLNENKKTDNQFRLKYDKSF